MSEKICPIISKEKHYEDMHSNTVEKGEVVCKGDKCQWWWKCREPRHYSVSGNGEISHEGKHEQREGKP